MFVPLTAVSQEVNVGPITGEQTIGFEFRYVGVGLFMIHHDDGQGSHQTKGRLNAVVCVADMTWRGASTAGMMESVKRSHR